MVEVHLSYLTWLIRIYSQPERVQDSALQTRRGAHYVALQYSALTARRLEWILTSPALVFAKSVVGTALVPLVPSLGQIASVLLVLV